MVRVFRNRERRPIRKDTAAGRYCKLPGLKQVVIDGQLGEAPRMRAQTVDTSADQSLEIAVRLLEMLRPKEHALGPDDFISP